MTINEHTGRGRTLALVSTYTPFLFILGLILGLIVHAYKPIGLFHADLAWYGQMLGFISLVLATMLFFWVHKARKAFFTQMRDENICIEIRRGPYKIGRHPGALSLVLLMLGISLVANALALFVFTFILVAIFTWIIHPFQEMLFIDKCGDMYRDYKKQVRMWF